MAEAATNIKEAVNVATIKGRIDNVRMYEGKHIHVVKLPAADAYSDPAEIELRSSQRLGEPGNEVHCRAKIVGYSRTFPRRDGGTGIAVTSWFEQIA